MAILGKPSTQLKQGVSNIRIPENHRAEALAVGSYISEISVFPPIDFNDLGTSVDLCDTDVHTLRRVNDRIKRGIEHERPQAGLDADRVFLFDTGHGDDIAGVDAVFHRDFAFKQCPGICPALPGPDGILRRGRFADQVEISFAIFRGCRERPGDFHRLGRRDISARDIRHRKMPEQAASETFRPANRETFPE